MSFSQCCPELAGELLKIPLPPPVPRPGSMPIPVYSEISGIHSRSPVGSMPISNLRQDLCLFPQIIPNQDYPKSSIPSGSPVTSPSLPSFPLFHPLFHLFSPFPSFFAPFPPLPLGKNSRKKAGKYQRSPGIKKTK